MVIDCQSGEIHILMMGDPGVAKSQLLGKVVDCRYELIIINRSDKTCSQVILHFWYEIIHQCNFDLGKSASGVGLTASVYKDPSTGEFSLGILYNIFYLLIDAEGGSVVIADTGICGIDEFDKLDEVYTHIPHPFSLG